MLLAGPCVRRVELGTLLIALTITRSFAVLAVFGGPHGALGGWPWLLNLPGLAVVYLIPGTTLFRARVGLAFLIQLTLWYAIVGAFRRWGSRAGAVSRWLVRTAAVWKRRRRRRIFGASAAQPAERPPHPECAWSVCATMRPQSQILCFKC